MYAYQLLLTQSVRLTQYIVRIKEGGQAEEHREEEQLALMKDLLVRYGGFSNTSPGVLPSTKSDTEGVAVCLLSLCPQRPLLTIAEGIDWRNRRFGRSYSSPIAAEDWAARCCPCSSS